MITDTLNVKGFYKDPFCLGLFGWLSQNTFMDYVAYKQQKLISCISGLWEVQDQGTGQFTVWCEHTCGFIDGIFGLCPHVVEETWVSWTLISHMRAPYCRPNNDLPKAPLP